MDLIQQLRCNVTAALERMCNWNALPEAVLAAVPDSNQGPAAAAPMPEPQAEPGQQAPHHRLLQHLVNSIPFEWTYESQHLQPPQPQQQALASKQQRKPGADSPAAAPAPVHAAGVGTPWGLFCLGGQGSGQLCRVQTKHEDSWMRDSIPGVVDVDCSQVYTSVPTAHSRQVLQLQQNPQDGAWAANTNLPALTVGLIGHSAAVYKSKVYVFGGQGLVPPQKDALSDAPVPTCSNTLSSFDLSGLLGQRGSGVVGPQSLEYQQGAVPSPRMYHKAAVDGAAGVMYVYGGVCQRGGKRVPADTAVGVVHAFTFSTAAWRTLQTTGHRPRTTTLLAFFMWRGHLMAVPDVSSQQQQYQLLQLDLVSNEWMRLATQGTPPPPRTEGAVAVVGDMLVVHGGKEHSSVPAKLLGDVYCLDLTTCTWERVNPKRVTPKGVTGGIHTPAGHTVQHHQQQQQQQQQQQVKDQVQECGSSSSSRGQQPPAAGAAGGQAAPSGPGVMAGHVGAAYKGSALFYGGYNHPTSMQAQARILLVSKAVKAPTPAVAHLSATGATGASFALQHCRQQLARLVTGKAPRKVLLQPDGGQAIAVPSALLALHSQLFDELFESLLEGEGTPEVPLPRVSPAGVAHACRWMMGLLSLLGADLEVLTAAYRAADVLIMEPLLVDILQQLAQLDHSLGANAAALMELAADFSGRLELQELAKEAEQQLCSQVAVGNASAMMELATRYSRQELRERCVSTMLQHRKNDVWGVLEFAAKFSLTRLQASCLATLQHTSRGHLVAAAESVVQVASRYPPTQQQQEQQQQQQEQPSSKAAQSPAAAAGAWHTSSPLLQKLQQDLLAEFNTAVTEGGRHLLAYVAAAEKLQLQRLRRDLLVAMRRPEVWRHMSVTGQAALLRTKHPQFAAECEAQGL